MDGNLHIGRGHSYLAGGNPVQAAGQLKVNAQGYIRLIVNDSGHYQPSVTEALNYPEILRNVGLNMDNEWIRIDEFISSMSNYVIDSRVFYNGPSMNILANRVMMGVDEFGKYYGTLFERVPKERVTPTGLNGAIVSWITKNDYEIAGAPFDIYLKTQFDSLSPDDWETEVYFPIRKK